MASCQARADVIALLLENGANPNAATTPDGYDALQLAVYEESLDVARLLVQGGANVVHTNKFDETCVDIAREKGQQEMVDPSISISARWIIRCLHLRS